MYQSLHLPDSCLVNSNIPKTSIYENSSLSPADKRLFIDNVKKIQWRYSLKEDTTHTKAYVDEEREYLEIEVLEVMVLHRDKEKRVAEIIMGAIPYPMLLVLCQEDGVQFWVSHQRQNKNDQERNVLEELISSPWVLQKEAHQILEFNQLNHSNFFALYSDMVDGISIHKARQQLHIDLESGQEARAIMAKHQAAEKQIALLRAKLKKESQFNRKMEIGLEIKKLERELK